MSRGDAMRRNVVLPAPVRPRRSIRSPRRIERETPRRASIGGPPRVRYVFRTSAARRAASGMAAPQAGAAYKVDPGGPRPLSSRGPGHAELAADLLHLLDDLRGQGDPFPAVAFRAGRALLPRDVDSRLAL